MGIWVRDRRVVDLRVYCDTVTMVMVKAIEFSLDQNSDSCSANGELKRTRHFRPQVSLIGRL